MLAAYVIGLSFIAQKESTRIALRLWPVLFLLAPLLLAGITALGFGLVAVADARNQARLAQQAADERAAQLRVREYARDMGHAIRVSGSSVTNAAEARNAFRAWATLFEERLDQVRH